MHGNIIALASPPECFFFRFLSSSAPLFPGRRSESLSCQVLADFPSKHFFSLFLIFLHKIFHSFKIKNLSITLKEACGATCGAQWAWPATCRHCATQKTDICCWTAGTSTTCQVKIVGVKFVVVFFCGHCWWVSSSGHWAVEFVVTLNDHLEITKRSFLSFYFAPFSVIIYCTADFFL